MVFYIIDLIDLHVVPFSGNKETKWTIMFKLDHLIKNAGTDLDTYQRK